MSRFSGEIQKTEIEYKGDRLIPDPVDQVGPECVLRAILNGGQMEIRRVYFEKQLKCDFVFDDKYFRHVYERETRVPLIYDRRPRIRTCLTIFRDLGIRVISATLSIELGHLIRLTEFTSYPPKVNPVTMVLEDGLQFEEVMGLIRQNKPVLGSFAVDESFRDLGPEDIYGFMPVNRAECDTHCVLFIDGGYDTVTHRNYLKFLNSHGPGFGDKGCGRVYFDLIYQANTEYCFHTMSFEPNAQQPMLACPILASSTEDYMAETSAKQKQFGVTPARLMDPLTQYDYERTNELQKFLGTLHLSENPEDSAQREAALLKIDGIVKTCVKHMVDEGRIVDMPKILVLKSGSFSLQVHLPTDELELVCIGPSTVNHEDFFKTLHCALRNMKEIDNPELIQREKAMDKQYTAAQESVDTQHSAALVLRFKLDGKSIVLLYAILSEVPTELSAIFENSLSSCIDEANLPVLDRCRVPAMIIKLVPNIENFQITLRFINFWAKKRGLYSDMNGFLGGKQWAVMVARVCQSYPRAVPSVLVTKFFQDYAQWFWPSPIMLCLIDQKQPLTVWDAPKNKTDESHVMPIISPAYPCRNSSAFVSEQMLNMLKEEFVIGVDTCEKIRKGDASWSALCGPHDFFKVCARYLQISIKVNNPCDLGIWKQMVKPLWRELPRKIEGNQNDTRTHWHPYEYYDPEKKTCFLFMGLSRVTAAIIAGQVVTTPSRVSRGVLDMFMVEADNLKGPGTGMEIEFIHHVQEKVASIVSDLVRLPF